MGFRPYLSLVSVVVIMAVGETLSASAGQTIESVIDDVKRFFVKFPAWPSEVGDEVKARHLRRSLQSEGLPPPPQQAELAEVSGEPASPVTDGAEASSDVGAVKLEDDHDEHEDSMIADTLAVQNADGTLSLSPTLTLILEANNILISAKLLERAQMLQFMRSLVDTVKEEALKKRYEKARAEGKKPLDLPSGIPRGVTMLLPSDDAWNRFFEQYKDADEETETPLNNNEMLRQVLLRHLIADETALWSSFIKLDDDYHNLKGHPLTFSMCPPSEPSMVCLTYVDATVPISKANIGGLGFVIHRLESVLPNPEEVIQTPKEETEDRI